MGSRGGQKETLGQVVKREEIESRKGNVTDYGKSGDFVRHLR